MESTKHRRQILEEIRTGRWNRPSNTFGTEEIGISNIGNLDRDVMYFPLVFLKIKVSAEAFGTNIANEGLLVVMRMHVEGQIVDLVESFVTHVTFVGLLSCMRQSVVLVIALLMEPFAAEFANEWLIACMNS